jgi:hypothetical protein
VSIHATGRGPDDPYLADLVAATRRSFGDKVPMLLIYIKARLDEVGPEVQAHSEVAGAALF